MLQKSGPSFNTRWGQIGKFQVQHDSLRLSWESHMVALRTPICSISHQVPLILAAKSIYNSSPLFRLDFSSDLIHSPLDQGNSLLTWLFFQSCSDCNHAPGCRLRDHFVQHIWSLAWQYFRLPNTPVHLAHSFSFYIFCTACLSLSFWDKHTLFLFLLAYLANISFIIFEHL